MESIYFTNTNGFVWKMGAEFDVSEWENACTRQQDTGISKRKVV